MNPPGSVRTLKKALLITLFAKGIMGCRIPAELCSSGFQVAAICATGNALSYTRYVSRRYTIFFPCQRAELEAILFGAIEDFRPDIVIPCDDQSVWFLHDVLRDYSDRVDMRDVLAIIRQSVGEGEDRFQLERKSALAGLANSAKVQMPETIIHETDDQTIAFARDHRHKVVIKSDFSGGGNGVHVCQTQDEVYRALGQSSDSINLNGRVARKSVQRFLDGVPLCVSGVAWNGRLLEAFAFTSVTTKSQVSPSCVIDVVGDLRPVADAGRLVAAARYSGFFAIDFIICSERRQGFLLEFNARISQTSHLGRLLSADLCGSLHDGLCSRETLKAKHPPRHRRIALFPFEWRRDSSSPFLETAYHDVPWHDPHLVSKLTAVND